MWGDRTSCKILSSVQICFLALARSSSLIILRAIRTLVGMCRTSSTTPADPAPSSRITSRSWAVVGVGGQESAWEGANKGQSFFAELYAPGGGELQNPHEKVQTTGNRFFAEFKYRLSGPRYDINEGYCAHVTRVPPSLIESWAAPT